MTSQVGVDQVRQWVRGAQRIVGFSGAGISTESGIPDFRSPNGVWATNRIIEYDEFVNSYEGRVEYWRQKCLAWPEMRAAEPNAGHLAFVEMHRQRKLHALITQNIDGLHQQAGLPADLVHEIHGTTVEASCLSCGDRISSDEACERVAGGELAPVCRLCGGLLKPATISFGQPMPANVVKTAQDAATSCDLFITVGSSLVVYPAAALPVVAKRSGAKLVIINRDPTPLDEIADVILHGEIGATLPALLAG